MSKASLSWHTLFLGLAMLVPSSVARAQAPVKTWTPQQQEQLKTRDRLSQECAQLEQQGRLDDAIVAAEKMLALERSLFAEADGAIVPSLVRVAGMYERQEDFAAAKKRREEVLRLQKKRFGADHWQLASARLALQNVEKLARLDKASRRELKDAEQWMSKTVTLFQGGKHAEGAAFAEKSLQVRLRVLGNDDLAAATSASWAGISWQGANQLDKARAQFEQALAICTRALGAQHPETAQTLQNLGSVAAQLGDYDAAGRHFARALVIRKKAFGDDDPATTGFQASLSNLVEALAFQARQEERQENFAAAQKLRNGILLLQKVPHGEAHWQVTDAELALRTLEKLTHLDAKARQDLKEADQWMSKAVTSNTTGKYVQGAECAEKALAIRVRVLGQDHPQSGDSALLAGNLWERAKQFDNALARYEQAAAIRKKALGDIHPRTAASLHSLGALLQAQGRHSLARGHFEQALAIRKKALGDNHPDTSLSLNALVDLLETQGEYAAACAYRQEALALQKKRLGADHWQVTDARLALKYVEKLARLDAPARQELQQADQWMAKAVAENKPGKYEQGAECAEKALAIRLRWLGEDYAQSADSLFLAGFLWGRAQRFDKALAHAKRALAIRANVLGDTHPNTLITINNLGVLQEQVGDFAAARISYERALAIRKKVLGDNHPDTALSLHNLAVLLDHQGDYGEARAFYEQALAIQSKTLGTYHPDTATSLNNLGKVLQAQGDFAGARAHYEQAVAIRKKVLGTYHGDTAICLNNVGLLLQEQGDYAAARAYNEQALAILKKVLGPDHLDTATSLHNLGLLLGRQGDFAAARGHLEQALAIRKKTLGENHLAIAESLNCLGQFKYQQGEYASAQRDVEQALLLQQKILGDHPDTASTLNGLGELLRCRKDYSGARSYYEKALAIYKKTLGNDHPSTASVLGNLGNLLVHEGDYDAAQRLYEQALAIRKKALGDNHAGNAVLLDNLGTLFRARKDHAAARSTLEAALRISRRSFDLSAMAQSERQQLLMRAELGFQFDNYLSIPIEANTNQAAAYTQVLAWKGTVFAYQQRLRLERANPKLAVKTAELRAVAAQLNALALTIPDLKKRDAWTKQLQTLSERMEALERDLAKTSQAFRLEKELKDLSAEKLQQLLPVETVLVDFLVYSHSQPDPDKRGKGIAERRLTVFVVRGGADIVRLDLGPMAPIEAAIDEWRALTKIRPVPGRKHPGVELRRLLWEPLEKHVQGAKVVLVAPDDALGRLPFVALPGSKAGTYLLEDVTLTVLPAPRLLPELLEARERKPVEPSLLLVGDVDFDAMPGKSDGNGRPAPSAQKTGEQKKWIALPGTKTEIQAIRDSFKKRFTEGKVEELRREDATQKSVRDLAPRHSILHLATHGFFADPKVRSAFAAESKENPHDGFGGDLFGQRGVTGFHPGLLSGLVLAGANRPTESGGSDGVLTALEVAELDLRQVDLAVLSACETGLGKTAGGEGVLGLQRAFQVAGARTTVTSVWSVPDEATRVLMERFYENLWDKSKPRTKLEAMREAQLWMLREGRTHPGVLRGVQREDPPQTELTGQLPPYYWAAFILSGDWR